MCRKPIRNPREEKSVAKDPKSQLEISIHPRVPSSSTLRRVTPALGPTNPVSNKLSPLRVRDPAGGIGVANANRKALNPSSASSLLYFSPHTPAHPSSELRSLRGLANSSSSFLPAASIQAQQPKRWRRSRPPSSSGARRGFPASRRRGATT
jgi:hypothetical protein